MRLLIPLFIIVLGMFTGVIVCLFFKETAIGFKLSVLAGGLGAFAGLMIRDILDITIAGDLGGALMAAILGAALSAAVVNALFGRIGR
ncbi:hypothetical protein ACUNV4_01885 [Granulosicoccus sp. 3-233]|uniref:hypothetical protein n=1 Tax=Granulosicoccus sp. 3-233 TaxID=3417969 RepID=UPI003D32C562